MPKNNKVKQHVKYVNVGTQTDPLDVRNITDEITRLNQEVKNANIENDLMKDEIKLQASQIAVRRKFIEEINQQVNKLKKARDEIRHNNGILEKLLETIKDEVQFYQEEEEEATRETDNLMEWKKQFLQDQTEQLEYLEDTLYYAKKIRLAVNSVSDSNLDGLNDLFHSSREMLPLEVDETRAYSKKKQSFERQCQETKESLNFLREENDMLLQKLDRITVRRDLGCQGDHFSENNNHCDYHNQQYDNTDTHSEADSVIEPIVPRLDLSFLNTDSDSMTSGSSTSTQSSDSDESNDSTNTSLKKKKNIFQRFINLFK